MDAREKILQAATALYAETGFRGATTRQIAELAGVNEVTLFRQFGSKTALLHEAIRCACSASRPSTLPDTPRALQAELLEWAEATWEGLWQRRAVIRTAMGEIEERPELFPKDESPTACAGRDLGRYLDSVRAAGLCRNDFSLRAAATLLMGCLFADAMSRDIMPRVYLLEPKQAIAEYVGLFVRAIGAEAAQ
jgi:AcrR family transcriptional regulator